METRSSSVLWSPSFGVFQRVPFLSQKIQLSRGQKMRDETRQKLAGRYVADIRAAEHAKCKRTHSRDAKRASSKKEGTGKIMTLTKK